MQEGGVVLNNRAYPPAYNHGIKPLYDMLELKNTKVTLLTVDSLNGFMFKIDIGDDIVEYPYLDLLPGSQRFSVDVKSFIIKIVVVSKQKPYSLAPLFFHKSNIVGDYTRFKKEAVSPESFETEAEVQDSIWIKSVSGSRPPICPSVAYASILEDDVSDQLLGKLQERLNPNDNFVENVTITYLADAIYNRQNKYYYEYRKLGILLMPTIPDTRTFYRFTQENPNDPTTPNIYPEVVKDVVANIIAQIARMFIELKIIHLDLHIDNVMVYKENENDEYKSKIIDFGRASILDSGDADVYFSVEEKAEMLDEIADIYAEQVNEINIAENDEEKVDFMHDVMDYITDQEKSAYQKAYPGRREPGYYQLNWIELFINDDAIMLSAFNKLHSMMLVNIERGSGISYRTINSKHRYRLDFPRKPEPVVKRPLTELESDPRTELESKKKRGPDDGKRGPDDGKLKLRLPGGKSKKSKLTKKSKPTKKSKTIKKSKKSKTL